jgi:hypothetical protein
MPPALILGLLPVLGAEIDAWLNRHRLKSVQWYEDRGKDKIYGAIRKLIAHTASTLLSAPKIQSQVLKKT